MHPFEAEDVILREHRRAALARRLILHGVRTEIVTRLTGLTRNRLATLRRRLMVFDKTRPRGPARSPLTVLLSTPLARAEAAALVTLLKLFEIPIELNASSVPKQVSLTFGERLCDTYEAYSACFPWTQVQLEELIGLRGMLADRDRIQLRTCPGCKCLVIDRYDGARECLHCHAPSVQ